MKLKEKGVYRTGGGQQARVLFRDPLTKKVFGVIQRDNQTWEGATWLESGLFLPGNGDYFTPSDCIDALWRDPIKISAKEESEDAGSETTEG